MSEWFADESFWEATYPYMFHPERMEAAEEQVSQLLALAQPPGQRVLDLCCGPGRHAVALARRGWSVTGVDRSPFLLARARERAGAAGVEVEWVEEDMRRFRRPESFDLALSLFTSFGYFASEEENRQVLANLRASLRPGGACVVDVAAKEWVVRHFAPAAADEEEDGTLFVQRRELVADCSRARNQWILIRDGRARSFTFEHTLYSGQELRWLMEQAGFGPVTLHGDLAGAPFGLESRRLVAVGRRGA